MSQRLPACDPCRSSKLSCDHAKPVCSRCRTRDVADECSYRDRPFKKRKVQTTPASVEARATSQSASAILNIGTLSEDASRKAQRYPNPGYLGSSSHTTFFDHLAGNDQSYASTGTQVLSNGQQGAAGCAVTEEKIVQGASIITQIRTASRPLAWKSCTCMG